MYKTYQSFLGYISYAADHKEEGYRYKKNQSRLNVIYKMLNKEDRQEGIEDELEENK